MEKNCNLTIEKCVQGGAGIARLPEGMICFVKGVLPGEVIDVEITEQKKGFATASLLNIYEPHPMRSAPLCKYYGKCGGCNAQHAAFELQIKLQKEIISDLFLRTAKVNLPQEIDIHYGSEWGYRCRAKVFATENETVPWGFQERASNTVVPIESCMILSERLNKKLNEPPPPNLNFQTYLFDNQSEKFLGKYIHADETVFFQSNLELLPNLINAVKKAAKEGELLFDFFAGVGLFSAFLGDKFERIIAVEQSLRCREFAQKNLSKNCEFHASSVEEWLGKNAELLTNATVLIDPPRTGMSKKLRQTLCKNKPSNLIYVSCDPATLARDTGNLLEAGYQLINLQGFAFYPQTFHLEMLAEFKL